MEDKWMILIFLIAFISVNFAIVQKWIAYSFSAINIVMVLAFIFIFYLNKRANEPKSLLESIKAARQFYGQVYFDDKNKSDIKDVLEVSREKDFIRATKKGVVHDVVIEDNDGETRLIKDDAFDYRNPASIVFMSKLGSFQKEFYKSKAEIEREMKPIITEPSKHKFERKVKIERKERVEPQQQI